MVAFVAETSAVSGQGLDKIFLNIGRQPAEQRNGGHSLRRRGKGVGGAHE